MPLLRSAVFAIAVCAVLWAAGPAAAADVTVTYTSTGAEQAFVVPPGVWSVHVVAVGGSGAAGGTGLAGGRGAAVTADLPVSPGATLYVEVGGNGSGTGTTASGFNGGAPGGNGCCAGGNAGAGGGATDLRQVPRGQAGTLHTRVLVAAGGGGGGGFGGSGTGGPAGSAGHNGLATGINGGGAGTASAGGTAGGGAYGGQNGTAGTEGDGGAGGSAGGSAGGGGGGGGYFGGGGGGGGGANPMGFGTGTGAGGGGGSSFLAPGVTGTVATDTTGVPKLTLTYAEDQQPSARASAAQVAFAAQTTGSVSSSVPVRVINDGPAPLLVSSVATDGPNADDFLVDSGGCLAPVDAGSSCTLKMRFAPPAAGARVATLVVDSNDPAGSLLVQLSGTGVALPAAVNGAPGPAGPAGPAGKAAKLPVVTCKTRTVHKRPRTTCTLSTKLKARSAATLYRNDRVYATGKVGRDRRLRLTGHRRITPGTYALRVVRGRTEQRVAVRVRG